MENNMPLDLISTTEARRLLGVSTVKMTQLLKEGVLRHFNSMLDKRTKLVSRAEVLALKSPRAKAA
jgi:hypothetical protein